MVPPPSKDPFYAVPPDAAQHRPGEVIRAREIDPIAIAINLRRLVKAWQVLYRTNDHKGPTATVATILVPKAPWSGGGTRPLLSYQSATDAVGIDCNPSYTWRAGIFSGPQAGLGDPVAVAPALLKGWAVVVADYEGPEGLLGNYQMTAHGVLDGIRAALNFAPAGLGHDTRVGAFGYSGGGYATAATAEQQASYAPELNYVGTAAGGIPADHLEVGKFLTGVGRYAAGFAVAAVIGHLKTDPSLFALVNDKGKALAKKYWNACAAQLIAENAFREIKDFVTVPDLWKDPRIIKAAQKNSIGNTAPTKPIYAFHGIFDEVIPFGQAKEMYQKWCSAGAPVKGESLFFAEHGLGVVEGFRPSYNFLTKLFDNQPVDTTCHPHA
ncbi:lipase family protein [Amycolatopsis anabasis]|uniref:lipase family protein n=1 Tax=Amycolatopsis anabasis TaxID=1840409 RepID=UPI00131CC31A|nr:lipase family protein [Amycolatopsis anabasis]